MEAHFYVGMPDIGSLRTGGSLSGFPCSPTKVHILLETSQKQHLVENVPYFTVLCSGDSSPEHKKKLIITIMRTSRSSCTYSAILRKLTPL